MQNNEYDITDEMCDDDYGPEPIVMSKNGLEFYKYSPEEKVWSVENPSAPNDLGEMLYSFDGETVFNFFADFHKLTEEQKKIFAEYNPTMARLKGY